MGIKISALPSIVAPATADVFPVVQSGVTYKETVAQLITLLSTSITSLTGLTGVLQAPTAINDINGNHVLTFTSNPSANTYINITNNSAGNTPSITAGGVTNVGLAIVANGTGVNTITSLNANPLTITSGSSVHTTAFTFANTNNIRTVTFPDQDGTVYLSSKANGTEAANAVTTSGTAGVITTSSLTTGTGSAYAITWTNPFITTSSIILLSLMGGTNTKNTLEIKATAGSGTSTITITNNNGSSLDGTVLIGYMVIP